MPLVGMRRSMRVFVPKTTDGEGVMVLRSGTRLWVESGDRNFRGKERNEWLRLIDGGGDGGSLVHHKENSWHEGSVLKQEAEEIEVDADEKSVLGSVNSEPSGSLEGDGCVDKMYGNLYRRKRKSFDKKKSDLLDDSDGEKRKSDKLYGLYFVRRQRRKIAESSGSVHACNSGMSNIQEENDDDHGLLSAVVDSSSVRSCRFARLLSSVLSHLTVAQLGLMELSAFLLSRPFSSIFASCGLISSRYDHTCTQSFGFCNILGARQFIPLFSLHFSAAPVSFGHLHASMAFRAVHLSSVLVLHSADMQGKDKSCSESDEDLCSSSQRSSSQNNLAAPRVDDFGDVEVDLNFGVANLLATRGLKNRRRRSLRTRRARNPSPIGMHRSNASLDQKKLSCPFLANNHELRRSSRKSSNDIKEVKSTLICLGEDTDYSVCCSANILVVESDKCYRVERASIMLETSAPNQWIIAVKLGGSIRYQVKADTEIKPSSSNRFTHAVIWAGGSGWKLEFSDREGWTTFRELYKICGERNAVPPSPVVKNILVPGVRQVSPQRDTVNAAFVRPNSYITLNDELSRVFLRQTANYDMDSEDEEWLKEFNNELNAGTEPLEHVSEESFELMIDAFEKNVFCSPEDYNFDEIEAANVCLDNCRRENVESVHCYWMKKRKQKGAPLVRVFQLNQPRKAEVIAKPVLRKKRSLQRNAARGGRGKERSILLGLEAEQGAWEGQISTLRVEKAKAEAERSIALAICKRQRAQFLMGNGDLAMYRAIMAISIAQAAAAPQVAELHESAAHFLD
ncbi:hypothetical protein Nepgr_015080 [Nepenthes gracilis]|uniref:Enhancer of polycomb-like protein n=1 Tax=Nepenthes gracilis TaxID=150966 RepID=A0AAD3SLZ1_NEPGR|nr:hypothetical protein Nepgr_015080 [Nepenthes gracilis]